MRELFNYDESTGVMTRRIYVRGSGPVGSVVGCLNAKARIMVARVDGKLYSVHRLIWCWAHGFRPSAVGHRGRDKTDNRLKNLYEIKEYKWSKVSRGKTQELLRFNFGSGAIDRTLR